MKGRPRYSAIPIVALVAIVFAALAWGANVECTAGDPCAGTPNDDRILGTGDGDQIKAKGGADRVLGRGDPDRVEGGGGADVVIGGNGNDTFLFGGLFGDGGDDVLKGGKGFDTLIGGRGRDEMFGGPADDSLQAADHTGEGRDLVDCGGGAQDAAFVDADDQVRDCEDVEVLAER